MTAELTVVVPADPPPLNDRAARLLLRILEGAADQQLDQPDQEAPPAAAA